MISLALRDERQAGPKSFLNGFAAAGRPEDLLHASRLLAAPAQIFEKAAVGFHLDFGDRIVACQGDRGKELAFGVEIVQSHEFENALPPTLGIVTDIGDENAGSEIGELSAFGSVVIGAFAFRENSHARRFCAEALGFRRFERSTKLVGSWFVSVGASFLKRSRQELRKEVE